MKKHLLSTVCLATILLISHNTCAVCAQAESSGLLYQYMDISLDTATPELVDQIVLEKTGYLEKNEFGQYLISDFGYEFNMQVDFNKNYISAYKVFLSIIETCFGRGDEFLSMIKRDSLQFIDIETQLIERYGEPDCRLFYTDTQAYDLPGSTTFMFAGGEWNVDQMTKVCEKDKYLVAITIWGNVQLRLWVNWIRECKDGYLIKLDLTFLDQNYDTIPVLMEYPLVSSN